MSPGCRPASAPPPEGEPDPGPEQIDLVAAALADAEFYPQAWEDTSPRQRVSYREHALVLLIKGDPGAALQVVDVAGVLSNRWSW